MFLPRYNDLAAPALFADLPPPPGSGKRLFFLGMQVRAERDLRALFEPHFQFAAKMDSGPSLENAAPGRSEPADEGRAPRPRRWKRGAAVG